MRENNRLAHGLIPLLNLLDDCGVDVDRFLASVDIPKFSLVDPSYTISHQQELDVLAAAIDLIDEPYIGLKLAKFTRLHNFSVFGLAMKSCATLAEVLELVNRYPNLVWGNCDTHQKNEDGVIVTIFDSGNLALDRILVERDLACGALLLEEAFGRPIPFQKVNFALPEPDNTEIYLNIFRCPVKFEQQRHEMRIDTRVLNMRLPTADPLAKAFYEAQCATMSNALKQPFSYSVTTRDKLLRTTPIPTLEQMAETMHMTPRTLQRRLKDEDARYSELLQDARLLRAEEYLAGGATPIDRIANALGFMDAAAFSHAFKKWTGLSPSSWTERYSSIDAGDSS
ncbi:MAG: AraC family transcriptional regulator [Pseudomonadales bacterium]